MNNISGIGGYLSVYYPGRNIVVATIAQWIIVKDKRVHDATMGWRGKIDGSHLDRLVGQSVIAQFNVVQDTCYIGEITLMPESMDPGGARGYLFEGQGKLIYIHQFAHSVDVT